MIPTTTRSPPSLDDFVLLEEYQSQTPETFSGGKPILHYHATGAKAWISKENCGSLPIFPSDTRSTGPSDPEAKALGDSGNSLSEQRVDLFVNSEKLALFNQNAQVGLELPYPLISIHAIKGIGPEGSQVQTIWMQLELADGGPGDDEFNSIELTIIPPAMPEATGDGKSEVSKLYEAISACSDLHPDPAEEGDEDEDDRIIFEGSAEHEALDGFTGVMQGMSDGGLPPPMPGSSGWITAENVNEYFDEEGNWIGESGVSGELGDGAGRVRARDEVDPERVNGDAPSEDSESKRPRVD